jgi:hypothetical protein
MLLFNNTKQFKGVVQQVLLCEAHQLGPRLGANTVYAAQGASMVRWA